MEMKLISLKNDYDQNLIIEAKEWFFLFQSDKSLCCLLLGCIITFDQVQPSYGWTLLLWVQKICFCDTNASFGKS